MTDTNILSRKQLAENLGVHPMTIKRWEKQGLPVLSINSKTKRYDYGEVLKWVLRRANESEVKI